MDNNSITTPEEDIEIFFKEKNEGNLDHALFHLSCAIADDPANHERLFYLNELIEENHDLLDFIKLEDNNYFAKVALRAYILFENREYNEAFRLIAQVIRTVPQVPYLCWIIDWEPKVDDVLKIHDSVLTSFMSAAIRSVDIIDKDYKYKSLLHLSSLLERRYEIIKDDDKILWFLSCVQRRMNRLDDALKSAKLAYDIEKNYATCVGMAMVYRDMGNIEEAKKFYEEAHSFDPESESCILDLGDLFFDVGDYKTAKKYYEDALSINSKSNWALSSVLYIDYILEKSEEAYERLEEHFIKNPEDRRTEFLFNHVKKLKEFQDKTPYIDYIPEPEEASINVLKQVIQNNPPLDKGGSINLNLSNTEAPSAINSFRLYLNDFRRGKNSPVLNLTVESIPDKDPRKGIKEDYLKLWNFDENIETPCFTEVSDEVCDLIYDMANSQYDFFNWYKNAQDVSKKLNKDSINELIAIMLNPPIPPDGFTPWRWIKHIQYASVFVIANLDIYYLFLICEGQIDWPIEPAVVYLANEVNINPLIRNNVFSVFYSLLNRVPRGSYCFYLYAVVYNWLMVKDLNDELKGSLEKWKKNLEE